MRNIAVLSIALAGAIALPFAAQAADIGVARRTTMFAPVFSWTGVYIGASGGQVRGAASNFVSGIPLTCNNPPFSVTGTGAGKATVTGPASDATAIVDAAVQAAFSQAVANSGVLP